ncbi:hypothetical protein N9B90_01415 [bacterium]|nr:hypothetical protein [bacterium]
MVFLWGARACSILARKGCSLLATGFRSGCLMSTCHEALLIDGIHVSKSEIVVVRAIVNFGEIVQLTAQEANQQGLYASV